MTVKIEASPDATPLDLMRAVALQDPDPDRRWEVIGDTLVLMPSPKGRHGRTQGRMYGRIDFSYGIGMDDPEEGWIFVTVPDFKDVVGRSGIARPKIPDLAGWRPGCYVENEEGYAVVAPDWVCEILSPATAERDKGPKAEDYADLGIEWYWLVDLDARTLEVRHLDDTRYGVHAVHDLDRPFAADPFQEAPFDPRDFPR